MILFSSAWSWMSDWLFLRSKRWRTSFRAWLTAFFTSARLTLETMSKELCLAMTGSIQHFCDKHWSVCGLGRLSKMVELTLGETSNE